MTKKEYIIPIFIPFLGCPHDCAFCNQVKITNYRDKINKENTINQIETYLSYFPDNNNIKEIAFFGGSFTGLEKDIMTSYLEIAQNYKKKGIIDRIRLSTRPDYINNSILDILKDYQVDIIELGIQSLDNDVLDANERGHCASDSAKASKLIKDYGFILGHQIMPGLYKDSYEKSIKTTLESIKMKPDIVRIYPTLVIKDTKLEKLFKSGKYKPLSIEEAVKISAEIFMLYKHSNINVIRIGLQATENINEGKDVVAGPFHPSLRQFVETFINKSYIEKIIEKYDLKDEILIKVPDREISIIAGNKAKNRKYFYDKYKINLNFVSSKDFLLISKDKTIKYDLEKYIDDYINKKYGGDLI